MYATMCKCRDCKKDILAVKAIRYSLRHNLCGECAINRGPEFLKRLKPWQLEILPAMALQRAGLFGFITSLIQSSKQTEIEY